MTIPSEVIVGGHRYVLADMAPVEGPQLKVGDIVEVTGEGKRTPRKGWLGKVATINKVGLVGVEFLQHFQPGHTLGGVSRIGHGWWYDAVDDRSDLRLVVCCDA